MNIGNVTCLSFMTIFQQVIAIYVADPTIELFNSP